LGELDPKGGHHRPSRLQRRQPVCDRAVDRMPQLSVIDVLSTNEMCCDRIPVMTVDRRVDPVHRLDELGIGNLPRCNPSSREFSESVVKVVGIETYDVAHEVV